MSVAAGNYWSLATAGYLSLPTSGIISGGTEISLWTQRNGENAVNFNVGDTVSIVGSITSNVDLTDASVSVVVCNLSNDSIITTLYSGSVDFVANV